MISSSVRELLDGCDDEEEEEDEEEVREDDFCDNWVARIEGRARQIVRQRANKTMNLNIFVEGLLDFGSSNKSKRKIRKKKSKREREGREKKRKRYFQIGWAKKICKQNRASKFGYFELDILRNSG